MNIHKSIFQKLFGSSKPQNNEPHEAINFNLTLEVKKYLRDKIYTAQTIEIEKATLFRGQKDSFISSSSSFWSQSVKTATLHAKPYLISATLPPESRFACIDGFVDCLIGKFESYEELNGYDQICIYLHKLSDDNFWQEFKNISGIIDTTAFVDSCYEKIYIFNANQLNLTIQEQPNK